jgi:hypothetical protein
MHLIARKRSRDGFNLRDGLSIRRSFSDFAGGCLSTGVGAPVRSDVPGSAGVIPFFEPEGTETSAPDATQRGMDEV